MARARRRTPCPDPRFRRSAVRAGELARGLAERGVAVVSARRRLPCEPALDVRDRLLQVLVDLREHGDLLVRVLALPVRRRRRARLQLAELRLDVAVELRQPVLDALREWPARVGVPAAAAVDPEPELHDLHPETQEREPDARRDTPVLLRGLLLRGLLLGGILLGGGAVGERGRHGGE